MAKSPWQSYTKEQKIALYRQHVKLFADNWQNGERRVETLNKFCKVYVSGYDGAKDMCEVFMQAKTPQHLLQELDSL